MRNLKRALSLALASVMLLGMMVVGSSAAFSDEADVVNKEAVTITAGLGLFAGTDGKFNPKDTVTRAQMATVIVKMLYGSEINADQFKGAGSFSDVANFEGGWAEGYINLCASLKIVAGYGDGTFKPGKALTTAEAVTMIINALKVDAGEGTWPMTVMAAAEEIELFEDLAVKPGTNEALSRDALAGIVLNGLNYSPSDESGYTVVGIDNLVFDDMADALNAAIKLYGDSLNGKIIPQSADDSLMATVFGAGTPAVGYITANQATGADATTLDNGKEFDLETGLDMIGHFVKIYYDVNDPYENEDDRGTAYCVVENAEYKVVTEETTNRKEYVAAFGSTKQLTVATEMYIDGNYAEDSEGVAPYVWSTNYAVAQPGTYVIGENNTIIGYIEPANVYATKVADVSTKAGSESIVLDGVGGKLQNNEDKDVVNEYEGIAKGDYVTYVKITGLEDTYYNLTKATTVEGQITRTFDDADGNACIVVNGTTYVKASFEGNETGLNTAVSKWDATYTVYLTADGKWIGFDGVSAAADLTNVYYVVGTYGAYTDGASYAGDDTATYAQAIDMEGKETQILIDIDSVALEEGDVTALDPIGATENSTAKAGFYTFEKASGKAGRSGVMLAKQLTDTWVEADDNIFRSELDFDLDSMNTNLTTKTTEVKLGENDYAFVTANTKFLVIEAGVATALETAVTTGSITKTLEANAPMILSKDEDGNKIVEVMVIVTDDMRVSYEDIIYITADQIAAAATIGSGKVEYSVYMVNDGSVKTGFVADELVDGPAFYSFTYDATEGVYTLTPESVGDEVDYVGMINGKMRVTGVPTGYALAEGCYIVDTRTAKAIEDAEDCDYVIESLADLKTADKYNTVKLVINLNDDDEIESIFVIDVIPDVEEEA